MKKSILSVVCVLLLSSGLIARQTFKVLSSWDYPGSISLDWHDVAMGDIDGDGIDEFVLLKKSASQLIAIGSHYDSEFEIEGVRNQIKESGQNEMIGITIGNFDTTTPEEEVAILRNVTDSYSSNVLIYRIDSPNSSTLISELRIGDANYNWVDIEAGDFNGDGKDEILVLKKEWSQGIIYEYNNNTLTAKSSLNLYGGLAYNDWRGAATIDYDKDGEDEIILVRKALENTKDIRVYDIYEDNDWDFNSVFGYNHNYGTSHFEWLDIAAGDFDGNPDNGVEFVLYKNSHSNFIYYRLSSSGNSINIIAGRNYDNEVNYPWLGIDAGNSLLNNNRDEIIAIRKGPGNENRNLLLLGSNEEIEDNKEFIGSSRSDKFMWGVYDQRSDKISGLRDSSQNHKIVADTLIKFIENNNIQTFNFLLSESYARSNINNNENPFTNSSIRGTEYLGLVELLEKTKLIEPAIKVWVTLIPPSEAYFRDTLKVQDFSLGPYKGSHPANSTTTSFNELENFKKITVNGTVHEDPLDFEGWFKTLGELAVEYPNLVAINMDDFGSDNDSFFTPEYNGKIIAALRKENKDILFIPTIYYYSFTNSSGNIVNKKMRNYTDGFLYYFNNYKDGWPNRLSSGTNCYGKTEENIWDVHSNAASKNYYSNSSGNEEGELIDLINDWTTDETKIVVTGIYADSFGGQSINCSTVSFVEELMKDSELKSDGAMIYITQNPDSIMGSEIYGHFSTWDGGGSITSSNSSKIISKEYEESYGSFSTINYPNPFNPLTNIQVNLPEDDFISIKVYDVTGRLISTLEERRLEKGIHTYKFNGEFLSTGIYFYVVEGNKFKKTRKILLLK